MVGVTGTEYMDSFMATKLQQLCINNHKGTSNRILLRQQMFVLSNSTEAYSKFDLHTLMVQ